jgi:hypothetical protein
LLNDHWVTKELREEMKNFLKFMKMKTQPTRSYQDTAKAVQRGKFIAMIAHIKWTMRSQINDLMLHLKLLEKQEQAKLKTSRRREIIKIRAKINEIETKKTI